MRCLILGGDGMLGHQLLRQFSDYDVRVTLRGALRNYASSLFTASNSFDQVDVRDTQRLIEIFAEFQPQAVINAVGVIKQRPAAHDPTPCIEINSLFPHRLLALCKATHARLVHVSTDCVFSGNKGNYTEHDVADATDLYGRSKHLGEISTFPGITLRTSIIGLELKNHASLIEWYLRQQGSIRGFRRAIYSGVTTLELSRVIRRVIEGQSALSGVWHVASQPISKFELLQLLGHKLYRGDISVVADDQFQCDRSLNGSAFAEATGYCAPTWDEMLDELVAEIQQRTKGLNCYEAA